MTRTLTRTCQLCGGTSRGPDEINEPGVVRYSVSLICTDEYSRDDGCHHHDEPFLLCPTCSTKLADRLAQWAGEERKR